MTSLLFVVMPSVQSFYQILSQLTVLLYLIMYLLMFSGAIYPVSYTHLSINAINIFNADIQFANLNIRVTFCLY